MACTDVLQTCEINSSWGKLQILPVGKKFANLGFMSNIKKSGEDIPACFKAYLDHKNSNHTFVKTSLWIRCLYLLLTKQHCEYFLLLQRDRGYFSGKQGW